MVAFLLGVVVAAVIGLVTDLLTGGLSRVLRNARVVASRVRSISYDSQVDLLFMVGEWSVTRRLEPARLRTTFSAMADRPRQTMVDEKSLAAAQSARSDDSGDNMYLTGFQLDHRESLGTQMCTVGVAPSDYSEVRAIEDLRMHRPEVLAAADAAVRRNAREYLCCAVPSALAVNVLPVTSEHEVLCARRSAAVDTAVGLWTVGVFESMKRPDPNNPGRQEDLYALSYRALEEELGLHPQDCGPLHITWLGI